MRKYTCLSVGMLAGLGIFAGAAHAVLVGAVGGQTLQVFDRSETAASTTNSTAFVDLPGANVALAVPAGTTRLLTGRFTAESQCFNTSTAGNWCTIRILVVNASTGAAAEMNPASGADFAFDATSNPQDFWEGNAIQRSLRVGAGSYRIIVQRRVTSTTTTFRLDDWHFRVEVNV